MAQISELPNELEIQELSGLKDLLWGLPYYERDVAPDGKIWERKAEMKYSLWARSTIQYDQDGCPMDLVSAHRTLSEMAEASNKTDQLFGLTIVSFIVVGVSSCYFLAFKVCGCDNASNGYRWEYYTILILIPGTAMALGIAITASVCFKRILVEQSALGDWESGSGCVIDDPFMQISDSGMQAVDERKVFAILGLVSVWLILGMYIC